MYMHIYSFARSLRLPLSFFLHQPCLASENENVVLQPGLMDLFAVSKLNLLCLSNLFKHVRSFICLSKRLFLGARRPAGLSPGLKDGALTWVPSLSSPAHPTTSPSISQLSERRQPQSECRWVQTPRSRPFAPFWSNWRGFQRTVCVCVLAHVCVSFPQNFFFFLLN